MVDGASGAKQAIDPVRLTIWVKRAPAEAFRLFTERIGDWWPVQNFYARGNVVAVVFETRLHGRVYERSADGETADWGRVLAWEPPQRFVMSWHPGQSPAVATEIEVRFTAQADSTTKVELEHRRWERLGETAASARDMFLNGWPAVLARYEQAAAT